MGYRQISALFRAGIIFISVSVVIQLLVVTLPYWYFKEFSASVNVHGGLLFACAKIGHNKQCGTIENPQGILLFFSKLKAQCASKMLYFYFSKEFYILVSSYLISTRLFIGQLPVSYFVSVACLGISTAVVL
jgi:hypothetical protein